MKVKGVFKKKFTEDFFPICLVCAQILFQQLLKNRNKNDGSMQGMCGSGCGKFVYDDGLCRACFATQRESAASKCSKGCGKWVRLYYE
jgi:hypothetical protein